MKALKNMNRGNQIMLLVGILGALFYGFLNWRILQNNQSLNMPEEHYQRGLDMMRRNDWGNAVFYYQKAAAAGHGKAQINLGVAYMEGRGVEQNTMQACQWFDRALKQQKDLRNYHNAISCHGLALNQTLLALFYLKEAERHLSAQDWHYLQEMQQELWRTLPGSIQRTLVWLWQSEALPRAEDLSPLLSDAEHHS